MQSDKYMEGSKAIGIRMLLVPLRLCVSARDFPIHRLNVILLDLPIQRRPADAQQLRCVRHVAARASQGLGDQLPLPVFDLSVSRSPLPESRKARSAGRISFSSASTTALSSTLRSCRTLPGQR